VPARNQPRPSIETAEDEEFPNHKAAGGVASTSEVVVEIPAQPTDSSAGTKVRVSGQSRVNRRPHRRGHRRGPSDDASGDSYEEEEQGNDEVQRVDDANAQSGADAPNEEANTGVASKKRRKRSVTPDDAENIEVDPRQVKLADLAKDLRIGKKFERHDQIKQREKERRSRIRLERKLRLKGLQPPDADRSQATEPSPSASAGDAGDTQPGVPLHIAISYDAATATAPQFEVIDGQIVVNQQSLQIDRHAAAAAEAGEMAQVEEDEFSRRVTSASYRRKPLGPNHWTYNETERFYRALAMFGTNFQMISQMFPNKDRRQVKLKFNREERFCPKRVNAALIGEHRTEIDLDEFREYADMHLETIEEIQADLKTREEEHEATERRKDEEAAETAARKRAELYAGREAEDEASQAEGAESGKTKTRRKRGPRKRAAAVDTGFGI
jgi:transcription factor TFIIIB component B''